MAKNCSQLKLPLVYSLFSLCVPLGLSLGKHTFPQYGHFPAEYLEVFTFSGVLLSHVLLQLDPRALHGCGCSLANLPFLLLQCKVCASSLTGGAASLRTTEALSTVSLPPTCFSMPNHTLFTVFRPARCPFSLPKWPKEASSHHRTA